MEMAQSNATQAHARLAKSIHLAQSTGKSTYSESSCLDNLGDLGTEGGNCLHSLKSYAFQLKLSLCTKIEADPEVQIFCQRLLENILQVLELEGEDARQYPKPLVDAHPIDIMVYSLCIIAFLEKDRKFEALEEVDEAVSRFQYVIKVAVWMSECLSELTNEYLERGAYRKAAAICLLRSNLSTNLEDKLKLRNNEAVLLDKAGELRMALEVIKVVTRESTHLDESLWRSRAFLCISAVSLFDKGGETDSAIGAREEAFRILCAHATTYEFTDREINLQLICGMVSLLQSYEMQRNWFAATKLIESMDAHIDKHFFEEPIWKAWYAKKHNIALQRGNDDITRDLLLHYPFFDDKIGN